MRQFRIAGSGVSMPHPKPVSPRAVRLRQRTQFPLIQAAAAPDSACVPLAGSIRSCFLPYSG